MTPKQLADHLQKIVACHPEAANAEIWSGSQHIKHIGFDKRHKPARIKLGE